MHHLTNFPTVLLKAFDGISDGPTIVEARVGAGVNAKILDAGGISTMSVVGERRACILDRHQLG